MRCPKSNCRGETKVVDTRKQTGQVIRERECKDCGKRFSTREKRAEKRWVDMA